MSFLCPGISPLTSFGSLTAVTEMITTSVVSAPLPPLLPPPPALPPPVTQSVSLPSSGLTPFSHPRNHHPCLALHPPSLPSLVFQVESVWWRMMLCHWLISRAFQGVNGTFSPVKHKLDALCEYLLQPVCSMFSSLAISIANEGATTRVPCLSSMSIWRCHRQNDLPSTLIWKWCQHKYIPSALKL